MESIVKDNILEHLMDNNLINPTQHGLQNQFFETITTYFDSGAPEDIIYLDFSKALYQIPCWSPRGYSWNWLNIVLKARSIPGSEIGLPAENNEIKRKMAF